MPSASFEKLQEILLQKNPSIDISVVRKACEFAEEAHRGQTRDEGTSYFEHPFRVACSLARMLEKPDEVIIATALLHDTLEDCPRITEKMLQETFGSEIAGNIRWLSKEPMPDPKNREKRDDEYYGRLEGASCEIRLVKMADRLDNLKSLHLSPRKNKIRRYVDATRKYLLPAAKRDFPAIAQKMEDIMDKLFPGEELE